MTDIKMWKMETRKFSELVPNDNNPREISKGKLRELKAKIEENGFHNPFMIDNDNVILGGNSRYSALKQIGFSGDEEVPVKVPPKKLTEEDRQKLILDDNINEGKNDEEILKEFFDNMILESRGILLEKDDEADIADKTYDNTNCEYPIVPKYTEKYDAVVVFTENEIDFNNLCTMLNLKVSKSFKSEKAIGLTRVIKYKEFLKCLNKEKK